jgi:glycosyltransferase involved in cell wall biosynthesis
MTPAYAHLKPCIVVPVFNHEGAIGETVAGLKAFGLRTYLVDDGSAEPGRRVLDAIGAAEGGWVRVLRHPQNRGKGAACRTGCEQAFADGYTHAVQVDADGQHDLADLPKLLALADASPEAVVTGIPIYGSMAATSRMSGYGSTRCRSRSGIRCAAFASTRSRRPSTCGAPRTSASAWTSTPRSS